MTEIEKQTVINAASWCIQRIRQEGTGSTTTDYETASDDVCNKLAFLLDWLRMKTATAPVCIATAEWLEKRASKVDILSDVGS